MVTDSASNAPHMVAAHKFKSELEAEALEALLRENGIPARVMRRSHDSAFDGLMLNQESGDAIFVPEKDLEKATLLIEEYLQSVPKESGDDEWKRELATKRLRGNLAATWVFSLGSAGVGLAVMIEASGVPAKLSGLVFIALAIVFFWGFREQRRRDQEIVSQSKRKPE